MYHYLNAIIDAQTGTARIGYFGRVLNTTTNAVIPIYADDSGTPVSVVSGIANMAKTDTDGNLSFFVAPGTYHIDLFDTDGETFIRRFAEIPMTSTEGEQGDPGPEGPPGPADAFRVSLAALKGAPTSDGKSDFDGSTWFWTLGDFSGQADDIRIVKSDSAALTVGAWVRQRAAGVAIQQSAPNAAVASLETTVSAFAVPAQFKGNDDQQVGYLLASGKRVIIFPEREMVLTTTHMIPRGTKIIAPIGAQFNAGVNDLTMFSTEENTFGTQWEGGMFFGNGKTGVTCFDLTGFRHSAEIARTFMQGVNIGIYLRELCWDTALRQNFMTQVVDGIIVDDGSNAVTIDHPCISIASSTGITVNPGTTALPVTSVQIRGGYLQGMPAGVLDRARGTVVVGTYFEECTDADISWSGALMGRVVSTYHSSTGGRVCLQGRGAQGCYADGIVMQGDRTVGLFDFPTGEGNDYCRARVSRTAGTNVQLGNTQTLHIEGRLNGTIEPGDVGWDGINKIYGYQGTGPGNFIKKPIANGFSEIAAGAGTTLNVLRTEDRFFQLVTGGEAFTFTNLVDGQTVTLMLKMSGAGTTPITVAGTAIDMTGVADGKRKTVRATLNAADSSTVWIDEGAWK